MAEGRSPGTWAAPRYLAAWRPLRQGAVLRRLMAGRALGAGAEWRWAPPQSRSILLRVGGHALLEIHLKSIFSRDLHGRSELPCFQKVIDQNPGRQSLLLNGRACISLTKRHYRRPFRLTWTRRVLVSRGSIFLLAFENRLSVRGGHEQAQSKRWIPAHIPLP